MNTNLLPSYSPVIAGGADTNWWLGRHPQGLLLLTTVTQAVSFFTSYSVSRAKPEVMGPNEVPPGKSVPG